MTPNYGSCYFGPLVAGSRRPFWLSAQKHLSSWLKSSTLTVQGLHNLPNFLYNITGFFTSIVLYLLKKGLPYNSLCFLFSGICDKPRQILKQPRSISILSISNFRGIPKYFKYVIHLKAKRTLLGKKITYLHPTMS